jgi:hypothetical protein
MVDPFVLLAGLGVLAGLLIIRCEPRAFGWPHVKAGHPDALRFIDHQ